MTGSRGGLTSRGFPVAPLGLDFALLEENAPFTISQ